MAAGKNTHRRSEATSRRAGSLFCAACLIAALFLAHTWVRTESTQTIIAITDLENELTAGHAYHKQLLVEKERLKSDARITDIARTELNLKGDPIKQTIYFSEESG